VKKNLVLLGMMGVGKSTLGKIVAKKQGLKFIDTDLNIEKKFSMSISDIFKKKGEDFFRQEEEIEVSEMLKKSNCVIALGGGAFLIKNVRDQILKQSISIWIDVNLKILHQRTKWSKKRPLLDGQNNQTKINKLYIKRKKIYKLAKYRINCDGLSKEGIVKKIIDFYEKQ
tara:strand:- start:107 stop:616 length:510 start_codon:yes stop_codon:yes gene_type:complete